MHSGMYLQSLLEEVNICGACDLLQLVEQRLLVLAQGLKGGGGYSEVPNSHLQHQGADQGNFC